MPIKLRIEIDLDNATFEYQPGTEISHILEGVAARFWGVLPPGLDSIPKNIRDSNGSTVGTVEVTE